MASIQERIDRNGKPRYTARIRVQGERPQAATFNTLTAAKQWAQRTESDLRRGRHLPDTEAKRRTLADAIDRYEESPAFRNKAPGTIASQKKHLTHWRESLGHVTLSHLTPATIGDERDRIARGEDRKEPKRHRPRKGKVEATDDKSDKIKPRSPATVVRYLAALSAVLSYTVNELRWIESNPILRVSKPKEPRGRVRILADEERQALLKACNESDNPHLHDVVVLALSTAARKGELRNLEWRHVDFDQRRIVLDKTKNGDRRVIPIRGEAERILEARSRIRRIDNPFVFPAPFKRGKEPGPVDFTQAWYDALEDANIEDFRFHDLRHSAASYLAMNGATLTELAEVLGHRTLQMVRRYSHLTEAHTGDLLERMNDSIFKTEAKGHEKKA